MDALGGGGQFKDFAEHVWQQQLTPSSVEYSFQSCDGKHFQECPHQHLLWHTSFLINVTQQDICIRWRQIERKVQLHVDYWRRWSTEAENSSQLSIYMGDTRWATNELQSTSEWDEILVRDRYKLDLGRMQLAWNSTSISFLSVNGDFQLDSFLFRNWREKLDFPLKVSHRSSRMDGRAHCRVGFANSGGFSIGRFEQGSFESC